jgi:hypothetical protein
MKVVKWICCDEYIADNTDVIKTLLEWKAKSSDADPIKAVKYQINFIQGLLLMKDKLKKYVKSKHKLDSFLEYNELILSG